MLMPICKFEQRNVGERSGLSTKLYGSDQSVSIKEASAGACYIQLYGLYQGKAALAVSGLSPSPEFGKRCSSGCWLYHQSINYTQWPRSVSNQTRSFVLAM